MVTNVLLLVISLFFLVSHGFWFFLWCFFFRILKSLEKLFLEKRSHSMLFFEGVFEHFFIRDAEQTYTFFVHNISEKLLEWPEPFSCWASGFCGDGFFSAIAEWNCSCPRHWRRYYGKRNALFLWNIICMQHFKQHNQHKHWRLTSFFL